MTTPDVGQLDSGQHPMRSRRERRRAIAFVFVTVLIDAMGIGIILPVMPDLIRELTDLTIGGAALWGGYLSFVYALMQFAAGPTLGNLSDRFGRRPVLLLSLLALAVDYLIMGLAPTLWLLFAGRALAGIAGATYSTANAFIADVSPPDQRARSFGLIGAGFGVGFVAGPLLGGLAAELGTRAPFFAAAALAFANFMYGALVLPESLPPERRRRFDWRRANPLGAARRIAGMPALAWLFVAMFLFDLAHHVYPAIWSFYVKEAFAWSNAEVGLSLAFVGVCFALTQGWLIRFILPRLGEAGTAFWGLVVSIVGLLCFGLITQGWMAYVLIFFTALGAVVTPAMTGLMSSRVPGNAQGELQGALAGVLAVSLIISPVLMTQIFGYFTGAAAPVHLPGAPFLGAAALMTLALVPFSIGVHRITRRR